MMTQMETQDIAWEQYYPQLYTQVKRMVNRMKLPRWLGEEEDITWDVVQDSMRKIFEYTQRVERGEEVPVQDVEKLLYTTARNCLLDRRRKEKRLCAESASLFALISESRPHPSEVATENVYLEHLFSIVAQKIAQFPKKQRRALLTDLAKRMAFEEKPTTLQAAFQAQGFWLEEYRFCQPGNEKERRCHAALLYQANQRLGELRAKKDQDLQTYLEHEGTVQCPA